MLSWKEKVTQRLSRLIAEAASPSPPPPGGGYSPVFSGETQEIFSQEFASQLNEEDFPSNLSSHDNSPSCAVDEAKPKSSTHLHGLSLSPKYLLAKRWSANFFAWRERSSTHTEESGTDTEFEETPKDSKENTDHLSDPAVNSTYGTNEASIPRDPNEYLSYLSEKSAFMSPDLFDFFISCLPNIVKGCQWILLYRAAHGNMGFHFRHSSVTVWTYQIVGDMQGAVFGGLLDGPLKPTAKRKYQGTGQTFVFTTIYGEPRLFRATGANRFYYMCLNDQLAFGGGGNYALSLEDDLLHGTSGPCQTFGNLCLAHSAEFELKNVELWGFAHSSRYLT